MKTIISIGILFGQMLCTAIAVGAGRWLLIDTSAVPAVALVLSVIALAGLVYLRDGILITDGIEQGKEMLPPREHRPIPKRIDPWRKRDG